MTLDDEIMATEEVVQAARDAATEHLERATKDLRLGNEALARYKDFLDATILNARSTLARCREIVSASSTSAETSASIVQGILAGVRESVRVMYVAMVILEQLAGPGGHRNTHQGETAHATESGARRSCSFCGKSEAESKLVAGPAANICADCTRLACGVLGIALADTEAE